MKIRDIAIKNLLRRKARAIFILAGLVIGVTTVVTVVSFAENIAHDILANLEKYGANIIVLPRADHLALSYGGTTLGGVSFDVQSIRQSELEKIRTIPNADNIAAVGPVLLGTVSIGSTSAVLAGIDFDKTHILKPWWQFGGQQTPGQKGLLAGSEAQRVLGVSVGDSIAVNGKDLTVEGVLAPTGSQDDRLLFAHLKTAQVLLNKPDQVSMVEVAALCHGCPVEEMVAQIEEKLPSANVMAIGQVVGSRMEMLSNFNKFSYILSLLVVLAGGLAVMVTLMSSVKERTGEIGILRAVGFRRSHIMRIIFFETGAISLLAGVLGYMAGMAGTWIGLRVFTDGPAASLHFNPLLAAGAIVMALAVGLLAGAYPAILAARMDPNKALRAI